MHGTRVGVVRAGSSYSYLGMRKNNYSWHTLKKGKTYNEGIYCEKNRVAGNPQPYFID